MSGLNKKGNSWSSFLLMGIIFIALLMLTFYFFGKGMVPVKETERCADQYCVLSTDTCEAEALREVSNEKFIPAPNLKCVDKTRTRCCVPLSDPLSIRGRAEEKTAAEEETGSQGDFPLTAGKEKIHVKLNDEILDSGSSITMETGKKHVLHISAEGANAKNCFIQVLDENKAKITDANLISGTTEKTDCTATGGVLVTIDTTNYPQIGGKHYILEITLGDETHPVTTYLRTDLSFVFPDKNVIVVD